MDRKRKSKRSRRASKKSESKSYHHHSRALSAMSITELQFMAKSRGIPFGGLNKSKLIRKINNYKE